MPEQTKDPDKATVGVILPTEQRDELRRLAEKEGRSLSSQCARILAAHLDEINNKETPANEN